MAAAVAQRLGWAPDTFWNATPAELRLALGPADAGVPDVAGLRRMMEADDG